MVVDISLPSSLLPLDLALVFGLPVVFGFIGYQIGKWLSIEPALTDLKAIEQGDEDEDDKAWIADGDLAAVSAGLLEPCKMVLVVRTDLKLTPGQIYSQCWFVFIILRLFTLKETTNNCYSQATLACYKALSKKNRSVGPKLVAIIASSHINRFDEQLVQHWERTGQAKIALKAKSEEQLLELEAIAKSLNLCARSVVDSEKGENVRSVLAIGPAPVKLIDEVTGKLRLL